MPEISIIIPVYNCEEYIEETLNSIQNQTFTDFEIIAVDDGSTDNSAQIIEQCAKKDSRIHLIKQENAGVSCARNKGMEFCCGEYIAFCDADDLYLPNTLQTLINAIKKNGCDWIISGYERVYFKETENNRIPVRTVRCSKDKINYHSREEIVNNLKSITELNNIISPPLFNTLWNKLYKTSVIKDNNILFPQKVPMGEDYRFNLSYLNKISSLAIIEDTVYLYYINNQSATFRFRESDFDIRSETIKLTKKFFEENGYEISEDIDLSFIKIVYSMFANMYLKSNKNTHAENKAFFNKVINTAEIDEAIKNCSPKSLYVKFSVLLLKTHCYPLIMAFSYFLYLLRKIS